MQKFLLLFLFITSLYSKDTITWMIWDLPPNFILNGPQKNQGYQDIRLKMIQDRLPEYKHESQVMNVNRAISIYQKKDDSQRIYCTNDLISHPSLDIDDYLSISAFPFKGHYLVTQKNKSYLFDTQEGQPIVLKDLIQNKKIRLVVSKNRPYLGAGKVLHEYLDKTPKQTHITSMSTLNIGESMFKFVFKDRADYTFEYTFRASYYAKQLNVLDQLEVFPIKENEGVFHGFSSCVKTKKGKEVIYKVNDIIRELKPTNEWIDPFVQWLPTKQLQNKYLKYYHEVFLKQGDIYDSNPRSK